MNVGLDSSIMGPNDLTTTNVLKMPKVPTFDDGWSSTSVCVWDVAAAHLLLEGALYTRPEEVGGDAFLVTGNGPAWRMDHVRGVIQVCPIAFGGSSANTLVNSTFLDGSLRFSL